MTRNPKTGTHIPAISEAQVTPESVYRDRRRLLAGLVASGGIAALGSGLPVMAALLPSNGAIADVTAGEPLAGEAVTPENMATTYNNFYEFGTGKSDPVRHAGSLKPRPWQVQVDGLVGKPGTLDLEALLAPVSLEERIYRMRCVEAWSMVIPWVGVPLSSVLSRFEPLGSAKYVAFTTLMDPEQMPGQRRAIVPWPYREGLRLDEAMHPLTLLAVGMYGKVLPNQNGAPLRLVVPWKYGFKGIKSIVRITLTEQQPVNSWNQIAPNEYGFYANVNPAVDHPRWSQARERRLGEGGLFTPKRPTLPFNGYGEQVAQLYTGMDLRKWY